MSIRTNRGNDEYDASADRILSRLGPARRSDTHSLWEAPAKIDPVNGMRTPARVTRIANSVPAATLEAKGYRRIGPDIGPPAPEQDLDSEQDREIFGMTRREDLEHQLDAQAHTLRHGDYRANRPAFYDGGELVIPMDNDADVTTTKNPDALSRDRHRRSRS